MRRMLLALVVIAALLPLPVLAGTSNCHPARKCVPAPTPHPTAPPTATTYVFDDEFNGTSLGSAWSHHFHCCGTVTMDPSLSTVSGGDLRQSVVDRSGTWYGDIIDTKTSFTVLYGLFEARMQIPKGAGLWPAFWLYGSAVPEIDTMEVCANPIGTNGGNDASLLHTTVHYGSGQTYAKATRTTDLSGAFHVYGVDWRADHITWFLDGAAIFTVTDRAAIPTTPLPILVDLGAGGSWCGAAGSPGTLLVDWIRVSP